jgi:hypothetical protein
MVSLLYQYKSGHGGLEDVGKPACTHEHLLRTPESVGMRRDGQHQLEAVAGESSSQASSAYGTMRRSAREGSMRNSSNGLREPIKDHSHAHLAFETLKGEIGRYICGRC